MFQERRPKFLVDTKMLNTRIPHKYAQNRYQYPLFVPQDDQDIIEKFFFSRKSKPPSHNRLTNDLTKLY